MDSGAKYVVLNELLVLIALVMLFLFIVKSDIHSIPDSETLIKILLN